MKNGHSDKDPKFSQPQEESAEGQGEQHGIPVEALEILYRLREANARMTRRPKVTVIYTQGGIQ